MDNKGDLYGATEYGGLGPGVVFKLHQTESGWVETVLHYFQAGADDGSVPYGPITLDREGNIYGTVIFGLAAGGAYKGYGGVYKLTQSGEITWLYVFTGQADGANPTTGVVFDQYGNLYGAAGFGGSFSGTCDYEGCGVVYKLTPPTGNQTGPWTETVLYTFPGGANGAGPAGPLLVESGGNIYGTAFAGATNAGVIFELTPNPVATNTSITQTAPNPSRAGGVVNVSFTVAQTVAGFNAPTGTVTVKANTGESCEASLPANGKGSCSLLFITSGARELTASYSGDSGNLASVSSPVTQNTTSPTSTTITKQDPDPVTVGKAVTVHFSVTAVDGTKHTNPTGSVTVNASTGESCTGTMGNGGKGSCQLTFSAAGSSKLTARYAGDAFNDGSVSAAVAETVNEAR
jgi:hypothetical protein